MSLDTSGVRSGLELRARLDGLLGGRSWKRVKNNLHVAREARGDGGWDIVAELYGNDIAVMEPDGAVRVSSAGFSTPTTARRLTQLMRWTGFAVVAAVGYAGGRVSKTLEWRSWVDGRRVPFRDGDTVVAGAGGAVMILEGGVVKAEAPAPRFEALA